MSEYHIQSQKPQGYYESQRSDMLSYIPLNCKACIEFGCGTGEFSSLLKQHRNAETWAVEIDKESAKAAAIKLDRVINTDAIQGLEQLPNDYFDCAIFFDILEHLVDPYTLLLRIKTKLNKKGIIVCSIPNIRYYTAFKKYIFKGDWEYEDHGIMDKTHLRFFTKKSIIKMFATLDYEIIRFDGAHPTSSNTFKLLNICLFNRLQDVRYKHYIVVAKPINE